MNFNFRMTEVVIRRTYIAETEFGPLASLCGIFDRQCGSGVGLSLSSSLFLRRYISNITPWGVQYHSYQCLKRAKRRNLPMKQNSIR